MNIEEMIKRCAAHAAGVNPNTGEEYPKQEYEMIIPPPTIPEIMELMANGQPINSLQISSNLKFDDDGPADGEDSTGYAKLQKLIEKGYIEFDDPMMALDYAKQHLHDGETVVNPTSSSKAPVVVPEASQEPSQDTSSAEQGETTPAT